MSSATALLADAERSISSGAWDQALEQLEGIKQSDPNEPDVYKRLAYVQSIRGKFRSVINTYVELVSVLLEGEQLSEADSVIATVLSLNPECESAREKRIEIERKRGNTDRAVYLARELARLCIEKGDGDRSIRLLQEAQQEQPENLDISLELAEMFVSHGQIQDGANQYRKVANAFQEAGNIAKAAEAYRRMKVVQSDDPEVLLTLGRLYTELGKLDEAEQEFRSVLRHDLEHQDALLELGLVCQLKGRFRSGLLAFNKVLQNNPKLPKAMRKLGELNLSMGKQDEAVQHFLEAAQAYLEVEEREMAIETFQIVLGVDDSNAQAQQGLTNLGAPIEPKEFEPPLPPTPPEDEPPTPDAGLMSPSDLGEMPPAQVEPEPDPKPEPKAEEKPKSASSAKTFAGSGAAKKSKSPGRRKGLVSGGLGLRKGLVDPSAGGGKPMLGGKPTLGGGGGSTRAGLRRPGLGLKDGAGEKPMLGRGGMSKPTLRRRAAEPAPEPEVQEEVAEEVVESPFTFDDDGGAESPFEESAGGDDGFGEELSVAAGDLFDSDVESPFGEELGESLFDDEPSPAPAAPVIGAFGGGDDDGSGGDSGGLMPGFEPGAASADGESADDIFDLAGAEDLFGDSEAETGSLFDDDSLPSAGGLFDDDESGQGNSGGDSEDLFGGLDGDGEPLASATPAAEEAGDDLFGGQGFDNLFDDSGPGDDVLAASETIGSFGGVASDLFAEPAGTESEEATPVKDSGFDSLFSEDSEPADGGGEDLFATTLDGPSVKSTDADGGGLFEESQAGGDLFGEELFPDGGDSPDTPQGSQDDGGDDLFGGGDLFSTVGSQPVAEDEGKGDVDGLFAEVPPEGNAGLFEEAPSDDLFGGGLFDDVGGGEVESVDRPPVESEASVKDEGDFDLFSDIAEPSPEPESDSAGGLFDGFGENESEAPVEAPAGESEGFDLFSEAPATDDLFSESPSADDLFSSPDIESGGAESQDFGLGETSLDLGGGSLFEEPPSQEAAVEAPVDDGGLFDIPEPDTSGGLFDDVVSVEEEPAGSLFEESAMEPESTLATEVQEEAGGLFDSMTESSAEPAAPLDLELPMPGDPPLEPEPAEIVASEPSEALFDEPAELVESEVDEDALTIDKLRAQEMAKVVDLPEDESAESPEFMKLLELTLPRQEEDAPEEPEVAEVEEESLELLDTGSGDLFEQKSDFGTGGGDLFDDAQSDLFEEAQPEPEPEPEPEPVDEGPDILGKPKVSLSIEDESPREDVELANQLDASLQEADVAAKITGYRRALEDSPENLVMRTRLADLHLKYGLLEDALLQYRQVTRKNTDSISLLHRVIQAEFWTENYAEAGESLLALAKLHLKRGEHHDALDTLQSVLSLDPHHFEARKVLVSVFTTLEESKLAAHHLRQLAETALTKGEVDEAISAFQQLLEISNDPVFEERLAQIYESQGEMDLALRSFQSLVGRYQQEERFEEAARVTERIVELNPEALEDRRALVELYKKLGMSEKAIEQQFKLAMSYQEKGELEPAIQLYEGVLEHLPDNQDARRRLVDAYLDSGNVASALKEAEALTEHYLTTKDHGTAIELYSRLVEADPENVELQERLVKFYGLAGDPESARVRWIELSRLHEERDRYPKAAEAIQKALELDESQVDLQHRLALIYADKLDDKVAALTQLRKLFQLAPDRLDAVQMYIDILLKEEQVSEAGQVLQQLEQAGGEGAKIKNDVITSLKDQVENNPQDLKARFNYGELCFHLLDLDHAIEQFQQTRRNPEFELQSYNMLGLCFAKKKGFNMLDLAIKQFKKGLETKGHTEQAYLELRYNLAIIQYQNGRVKEALGDFKECYRVDITYRDVRSWIEKLESELASSGS